MAEGLTAGVASAIKPSDCQEFLKNSGYHNIAVSNIFDELSTYDINVCRVFFDVVCVNCSKFEHLYVIYSKLTDTLDHVRYQMGYELTKFAQQHQHIGMLSPPKPIISFKELQAKVHSLSGNKVSLALETYNVSNTAWLTAKCHKCGDTKVYKLGPTYYANISSISPQVIKFAEKHEEQHWKEENYPTVDNPSAGEPYKYKYTYNIPANAPSNKLSIYPGAPVPVETVEEVSPIVSTSISVSNEILKEVYRVSNFYVDLQSKFNGSLMRWEYGVYCNKCSQREKMNIDRLTGNYKETEVWVQLMKFCEAHSHGVTVKLLDIELDNKKDKPVRRFKDL